MSGWAKRFRLHSRFLHTRRQKQPPFVNFPLTFSLSFLLLMDLRRNRLDGGLTRLQPAPIPDKFGQNAVWDASPRLRRSCSGCAPSVNFGSQNIFNGLLRVPVNEKIPALNLI
jgi:hypothetical protein